MEFKIEPAAKVGERITKLITSAAALATEVHAVMVQCALHVREHGDTSLASRLVNEIENNQDENLRGASALNVQGIRYWFGMACPMVIDRATKKWKLLDKDSETYAKYVDRMLKQTLPEGETDIGKASPDKTSGPGGRIFFVDWCAINPYWDDANVRANQRQNIRVIGLGQVIGMAFAIETQVRKAKDNGLLLPEAQAAADEFIAKIKALASDFQNDHAVDLVGETRALAEFKVAKERGETETVAAEATAAGKPEGAPEQNDEADAQAIARVGGDVTEGEVQTPPKAKKAS